MKIHWFFLTAALTLPSWAQVTAPEIATPNPGQVLVSGTVPDEATKAAILARAREVYGADNVVDQIAIGTVMVPANWAGYVQKLINPNLKLISKGQLKIDGNTVSVKGEVGNEAQRQQVASNIATSLNPTYTVNNGLRVASTVQELLDTTLNNRIVEFEQSSATLTPRGQGVLDDVLTSLEKLKDKRIEVIGHTDNVGLRASNIALSLARADKVKAYFVAKGINGDWVTTSGQGSDRPVASNDTSEGRSRNRRIEFRVAQ